MGLIEQAADIKNVLDSVGAEADDEKIESMLASLEGKNVEDMIKEGLEKLVSIPTGGAAPVAGAAPAATEEKKEEEKKEEEEEEEDIAMSGGGLFGDDDDDW